MGLRRAEAWIPSTSLRHPYSGLQQPPHEPAERAQAFAPAGDVGGRGLGQRLVFGRDRFGVVVHRLDHCTLGHHLPPARMHFLVRPRLGQRRIGGDHQMHMVGHDRVGMDRDGELLGEQVDAVFQQLATVLVAAAGELVDAAQEGPAHASWDAVVDAWRVRIDEVRSGVTHGPSMRCGAGWVCQTKAMVGVGNLEIWTVPPRAAGRVCQTKAMVGVGNLEIWTVPPRAARRSICRVAGEQALGEVVAGPALRLGCGCGPGPAPAPLRSPEQICAGSQ